jgi:DNA-directed RNA polymerase
LGDDTSRGLLQFAEGKPLGQKGLEWLFIQVLMLSKARI